jgi:hypothetical protein
VQTPRTRIQLQSVPVTAFLNRLSRGGEWTALRAEVENSHSTAEIEEEEARARYMSGMKDTQKQGQRTSGASTSVQPEAEPSRTPATFSV